MNGRRRALPLIASLVALVFGATLVNGVIGVSAVEGRIVFTNNRSGNADIYVMDADGTNARFLAGSPYDDFDPAWSPDRSKIAFVSNRSGNNDLWLMNSDGSGIQQLTKNPWSDLQPTWSPDSRFIAFTSTRHGHSDIAEDIYALELGDTGPPKRLTDSPGSDRDPAWSPNGATIVFATDRDKGYEDYSIYAMDANGANEREIEESHGSDRLPSWSGDGERIAFVSTRDADRDRRNAAPNYDVFVMDSRGRGPLNLTATLNLSEYDPAFSGDATTIAFVRYSGDEDIQIFTLSALDGSNVTAITQGDASVQPDWERILPPPAGRLDPDPGTVDFGAQVAGTASAPRPVSLTNVGGAPVRIDRVRLSGRNPGEFFIGANGCGSVQLAATESCVVRVGFAPSALGTRLASLVIRHDGRGTPTVVPLSGIGIADEKTIPVTVTDFKFSPKAPRVPQGYAVQWGFDGPSNHTATDATEMRLFDSGVQAPGSIFRFRFVAAGIYPYLCSIHPGSMTGTSRVPIRLNPDSGSESETFKVIWSAAPPPEGFVFDVQIRRPGESSFSLWRDGVADERASFSPDSGPGGYEFRARLRRTSNGASSGWSDPKALTVR